MTTRVLPIRARNRCRGETTTSHKPERPVGELIFSLQTRIRTPVGIKSLQMGPPRDFIANKFQLLELRHGNLEGLFNFLQARAARPFRDSGNPFQKSLPKGIIFDNPSLNRIGKSQKLGHQMQIGNGLKKTDEFTKIRIDIDLLEKGLREPIPVHFVICIWSIENLLPVFPQAFISEIGLAIPPRFLANPDCIVPCVRRFCVVREVNFNCNFRILPRRQIPDL